MLFKHSAPDFSTFLPAATHKAPLSGCPRPSATARLPSTLKSSWFDGALRHLPGFGAQTPTSPAPHSSCQGGGCPVALSSVAQPQACGTLLPQTLHLTLFRRNPPFLRTLKADSTRLPSPLQAGSPLGLRAGARPAPHPAPVCAMGQ